MATLQLSDAERQKRDKIVAQLSSDNEPTIIVAMNMLKKMAAEHKVPVYEYLLGSPAAPSNYQDRARAERAEREAREAHARAQRAEERAREAERARSQANSSNGAGPAVPLPSDWRDRLGDALAHHTLQPFLDSWQEKFSVDAMGFRRPTPKMAANSGTPPPAKR